jgi:hypothetical protein
MAIDPAQLIDAISSKKMGLPPELPANQAPADPAAAAAPPAQSTPPAAVAAKVDPSTAQDAAATMGAPKDPATQDAILYEVEFGEGKKRKLTPAQISSTFNRYAELNHKHAAYKPALDMIDQMIEANPGTNPQKITEYVMGMFQERQNGQPASVKQIEPTQTGNPDDDDPLDKWEKENAATLPPGYRDFMKAGNKTSSEMAEIKQMLAQVLAASQGQVDAARQGQQDVRGQRVQAMRESIANNLDRAQAQLGLPDDKAEDFMTFASERGYTTEDFIDPRLVMAVMQDYKNSADSPEMERLRAIAQRRQAFTGSLGSTPSAAGQQQAAPGTGNATFDSFADSVMKKRGLA